MIELLWFLAGFASGLFALIVAISIATERAEKLEARLKKLEEGD